MSMDNEEDGLKTSRMDRVKDSSGDTAYRRQTPMA